MTPKLTVILSIIRESYAIHGHESTYDIRLLFYDISRCAVLSACQCDILVNTMDDCNPLAEISSFSVSTGNIRSDNHNVSVCMHEIESYLSINVDTVELETMMQLPKIQGIILRDLLLARIHQIVMMAFQTINRIKKTKLITIQMIVLKQLKLNLYDL